MAVPGYQVINLLTEALGLPADLDVKSMTVRAAALGGATVTLECLVPKAEGGALARAVVERRWVMAEDTAGAVPPPPADPQAAVNPKVV
jgi:hypothetical protein